jgi:hypothetical protein
MRRIFATALAAALVSLGLVAATQVAASAHTPQVSADCQGLHVALSNYRTGEAGPNVWYNWSPNKDQGSFDGPPDWPTDARGTWHEHDNNGGPEQGTFGTFSTSDGNGRASWFHREHGEAAGTNHVTVVVDGAAVTDEDFTGSFSQDYPWDDTEGHTFTVTVTAWDDPTGEKGYTFTESGSQDACAQPPGEASATVDLDTAADCDSSSTVTDTAEHAALTSNGGVLDESVGDHVATFTADAGFAFDGQPTLDVPYTIEAATGGCTPPPCQGDGCNPPPPPGCTQHCSPAPPPHGNPPPKHPASPGTPTVVDAGLPAGGRHDDRGGLLALLGACLGGVLAATGLTLAHQRRVKAGR